jgi:hypothetical protein
VPASFIPDRIHPVNRHAAPRLESGAASGSAARLQQRQPCPFAALTDDATTKMWTLRFTLDACTTDVSISIVSLIGGAGAELNSTGASVSMHRNDSRLRVSRC